jgi:hypothetical protein
VPCGGATYVFWPANKRDGHVAIVGDRGFLCKFRIFLFQFLKPFFSQFLLFVDIFKLGLKGPKPMETQLFDSFHLVMISEVCLDDISCLILNFFLRNKAPR